MLPLTRVAVGFTIVLVDIYVGWFDLIPDPLGWTLAAHGLGATSMHNRELRPALAVSIVSIVASLPAALMAHPPLLARNVVGFLTLGFPIVTSLGVATTLRERWRTVLVARWIAGLTLTLAVALIISVQGTPIDGDGYFTSISRLTIVIWLAEIAVAIWFMIWLITNRKAPAVVG